MHFTIAQDKMSLKTMLPKLKSPTNYGFY